ncbi:phosphoinositide 3-kinase adapter protein 1 isoform X1 [Drosophila albomicans]|uniref:Phosphoinositide 3-kinase adapter protein 1 isoform X1 n=2 Tax=Drosophila albomicans TaxID=7291 RepID=A0A9C6T137_DROAB|nr:phosphoinositide 3-kinase adapter protein 1 isoform X1 [Drosophila albomicans]
MFVTMDNSTNAFFSDNPCYFCNDTKSPRTPDSQSSGKGFSIFKRRNSKGSSPRPLAGNPEQMRLMTSANLDTTATMAFGSPRGSFNSLGGFSQHSFELQPLMYRQRSSNSHSESFRERLGSCNETHSSQCPGGGISEHDEVFNASKSQRHHTLPSGGNNSSGTRRHSFGNWAQQQQHQQHQQRQLNTSGSSTCTSPLIGPSSPDEVPSMLAPRPPVVSPNKFRGSSYRSRRDNCGNVNNTNGTPATGYGFGQPGYNMDDILIVTAKHSERAYLRATFLKNHFDKITKQRGRKPFNFLHIKIDDGPFSEEIAQKYQNTALQIFILCPALLALPHSFLMAQLSSIIRVEKVLAILLDVGEDKVKEMHKTALPSYYKWRRCVVRDNDQAQISNILGIATDILGRALCQRPPCQDNSNSSNNNSISRSLSSCSEGFTVLPKKVKQGQNKVLAMLAEPLKPNDALKLLVEKSGELIEIRNFKCRNPYTIQFAIPESCMEISTMIEIRIEKNNKSLGARPIKCESRLRELEQLLRIEDSPIEFMCHALGVGPLERDALDQHLLQCFQRNMPPNFHLLNGPYERQPHFFSRLESSPEEYPTLLHFAARWGFNRLCLQLMECPGGDTACGVRNCAGRTPAELAEQEGHHKLAQNIVSFSEFHNLTMVYHYFKGIENPSSGASSPGAQTKPPAAATTAAAAKNPPPTQVVIGALPASPRAKPPKQLPTAAEYMEMSSGSERENTPEVRAKTETMAISNLNYISVETEDENLQCSATEKHLESSKVLETPTTTGPAQTTNELRINEPPYYQSKEQNKSQDVVDGAAATDKFSQECSQLLEANAAGNDYVMQPSNIPVQQPDDGNYLFQPSNRPVEEPLRPSRSTMRLPQVTPAYGTLKRSASDASSSTRANADDELAEIMHDFKNNVLSLGEVELLVEKWKHRNDVQQSFREKQEQIDQMRREYVRINDLVKLQMKRDTPFERIKKLFSRQKAATEKHQHSQSCADSLLDETKSSIATSCSLKSSARPISSLSLQSVSSSSSSSGRLSTGSNCSGASLGDSGTHSDHEDRRQFGCRLGNPGTLLDNYLVPPPPRPVFTPVSTPGDERHQIVFPSPMSSCSRLHTPTSPTGSDHYQMFPSNIPVYGNGSQPLSTSQSSSYLNTIMETKEQDTQQHYQNGVTLQPIKVNERPNIIYGKLTKSNSSNGCSSFKPKQVACPQVGCIEVQAEVYQNVGQDTTATTSEAVGKEQATESPNYMNC